MEYGDNRAKSLAIAKDMSIIFELRKMKITEKCVLVLSMKLKRKEKVESVVGPSDTLANLLEIPFWRIFLICAFVNINST